MHRNTLTWSVLVLAAAGSMWACGTEDDSSDNPGGGGSSAGSGGKNSAGSAGAHAGTAGTAGKAQGGSNQGGSNQGGSGAGGLAGDGAGGAPEGAGAGGDGPGIGGSGGDSSEGGAAGSAPVNPPTLAQNCATVCADQATLSCTYGSTCVAGCTGIGDAATGTAYPEEYAAMIACQAQHMDPADYTCSVQSSGTTPAPKIGTGKPCQTEICKWTCDDAMYVDENVYADCGC